MHALDADIPRASPDARRRRGPAVAMALLALPLAAGVALAARVLADEWLALPVLGFALASGVAVTLMARGWTAPRLGSANAVTLLRLALAALLLVPLVRPGLLDGWAVFTLALLTLALDGLDGPLARRSGLAGPWGARFDMEVDAVFAVLLALVAWRGGAAGAWILLLGGMRYLFVLAMLALPWLGAPLPQRFRRKAVCVIQIATLVALLAPVIVPPVGTALALVALALLFWSFAADTTWLVRHR